MLLKKIIGILIILLNLGGLGFLLYRFGIMLKEKYFPKEETPTAQTPATGKEAPNIANDDLLPDEDDLLKDMDLSDLDNLDLDDLK